MGGTLLGVHIVALVRIVLEHTVLVHKVLVHKELVHKVLVHKVLGAHSACTQSACTHWCAYMLLHIFLHVHMVYILLLPQALEGRVN